MTRGELIHEGNQLVDAFLGHGIVDTGAHATHRTVAFQRHQALFLRCSEEVGIQVAAVLLGGGHYGAQYTAEQMLNQGAIYAFEKLLEIKPNAPDARPRIEMLKEALAKQAV